MKYLRIVVLLLFAIAGKGAFAQSGPCVVIDACSAPVTVCLYYAVSPPPGVPPCSACDYGMPPAPQCSTVNASPVPQKICFPGMPSGPIGPSYYLRWVNVNYNGHDAQFTFGGGPQEVDCGEGYIIDYSDDGTNIHVTPKFYAGIGH
jgi:hypothetical protein